MKILAVETSCDETAIAILACEGDESSAKFTVLSHALVSQIEIHREYGGVYPMVAKREHARNLVPLLGSALEEAAMLHEDAQEISEEVREKLSSIMSRENGMAEAFLAFVSQTERPEIDAIAVTYGPGLAPALWVGITFAQALSVAWNIPLVPVDHMEGHLMIAVAKRNVRNENELIIENLSMPVLALLISGGHTELDLMEDWHSYKLLGQTRDDAVGEAFDKVARMLGLPYPGGPEISRLAAKNREDANTQNGSARNVQGAAKNFARPFTLPRPMIDSPDFDFSFSGIKTAVLYLVRDTPALQEVTDDTLAKEQLAREFEDAVAQVLVKKTLRALEDSGAQTLAIGGGVSANTFIQKSFTKAIAEKMPYIDLRLPPAGLTGDNAVMIGLAGFYRAQKNMVAEAGEIMADGNLRLEKKNKI